MARIKSYTDIEQSKKLAEILPLETADYYHAADTGVVIIAPYITYCGEERCVPAYKGAVPCWSLAALLDVLKDDIKIEKTLFDQSDMFTYSILGDAYEYRTYEHENLIDACVEMIIKLKELNLL